MFISEELVPKPISLMHGGDQQNGLRAGTLSPALCRSMAYAFELLSNNKDREVCHLTSLRDYFLELLEAKNISFTINGDMRHRHPGNLNLQLIGVDAKTLITRLQPTVAVSSGSACNAGIIRSSYVLKALGLENKNIDNSIRIGFGRFNTKEEIEKFAKIISEEIIK